MLRCRDSGTPRCDVHIIHVIVHCDKQSLSTSYGCRYSSRASCVLTPNKLLQGSVGIRPRPSSSRGPRLCWFAPHQSATAAFNHVQTNRDKAKTHPHFGKKKPNKQANKQTNNSRRSRCESTFSDFLFVSQRIVIWQQTSEETLVSSWGRSLF